MTSVVQQKAGIADRLIAAGEASKGNLKVVGTTVAVVSGVVTVPVGTVAGAAGGAVKGFIKGDAVVSDARTLQAARVVGGLTLAVTGVAAVAGLAIPGLGPITLPAALVLGATGAGVAIAGSGLINGAAAAFRGAVDGGAKGFDAGVGAAQAVGGGAQYVTDEGVKIVKKAAKEVAHVVGVAAHNTVEAGREVVEDVRVGEAKALQALADIAKERANNVANGGPRFDKDGKPTGKDNPPDYKKL